MNRKMLLNLFLGMLLMFGISALPACGDDDDHDPIDGGADTDTDIDTETDSDTNTDTTIDTDTTTSTDTDTPTDTDTETTTDTDTTTETDTDTDTGTDTSAQNATIYQIQQGQFAEETIVAVNEVVVTTPVNTYVMGFFVQEPAGGEYSGIYVFLSNSEVVSQVTVTPGSLINITGKYQEYFELSELIVSSADDIEVVGTTDVPSPAVVTASNIATDGSQAENYEGVLVKVEDVVVTNEDLDFGEFEVTGSLRINDYFFNGEDEQGPSGDNIDVLVGGTFDSIIGALYYSWGNFKLNPRTLSDYENYMDPDMDGGPDDGGPDAGDAGF